MRDLYETREGVPRMNTCVFYLSRLSLFSLAFPRPRKTAAFAGVFLGTQEKHGKVRKHTSPFSQGIPWVSRKSLLCEA